MKRRLNHPDHILHSYTSKKCCFFQFQLSRNMGRQKCPRNKTDILIFQDFISINHKKNARNLSAYFQIPLRSLESDETV